MRRWLVAVLVGACLLLLVAISGGITSRANSLAGQRTALAEQAAVASQLLDDFFIRASSLIDLTARNPAFVDLYSVPGGQAARAHATGTVMDRIVDALGYLGRMYPDRTGQASFVDDGGAENARVVFGEPTPPEELGSDLGNDDYFTPTFALPPGVVYQSKPYLSKELNDWVISSGTQVFTPDRVKRAMVHFELPVESIRHLLNTTTFGQVLIVDGETGGVVIDMSRSDGSRSEVPDQRFGSLVGGWGDDGGLALGGRQAVYHRIPAEVGNANHWYAVAVTSGPTTILTGVGWLPLVVGSVSLLMIVYALVALRRARTVLLAAANTDPLTRLHNRRRLVADLAYLVPKATAERPLLLMLSDLNNFKAYNDTFGHPEGDLLLIRLAASLSAAVRGRGEAYRIGGDEFCVVAQAGRADIDGVVDAVVLALRDDQRPVTVTASHGEVLLPDETADPDEAMRLVDGRMYTRKRSRRTGDPAPHEQRLPADTVR
jgi:diguanylate cyclase (GGDEF)-like protein